MTASGALLIDSGDLPSLVAATIESRPQELVIYHPRGSDAPAAHREAMAAEHAAVLGTGRLIVDPQPPPDAIPTAAIQGPEVQGLREACLLTRAAQAAVQLHCCRLVWPKAVGPEAGPVGLAVQRASMVADLADLDARTTAAERVVIDLPLVDLTDTQLVDLAEDAGAPMRSFGPCDGDGAEPCRRCEGCRRWLAAFDAAGVPWPWAAITAQGRG